MSYSNNNIIVRIEHVWKKYSKDAIFHRSLREDMLNLVKKRNTQKQELYRNEFWALKDISMNIKKGESVGLFGPNGAGKSTILKLIANVTYPTRGTIKVNGRVAPLIEIGAGFHPDLSGKENIYVNGAILGMTIGEIREKLSSIIEFSELEEFIHMPVKKYSSGMYLRLGFSIAIHSSADVLLVDEILAVGDEAFKAKCIDKIRKLKKEGKTIVIVSHDKHLLEQLTERIYYLHRGEILA